MKTLRDDSSFEAERALNAAIVKVDLSRSFEEFLAIFDHFYAEDVRVTSEGWIEPAVGKQQVRSLLVNFLAPFHVMAEVGGVSVSIRNSSIYGDVRGTQHASWTLEVQGGPEGTVTWNWCSLRKWSGSRVVYEYHYEEQQIGGPLTLSGLGLDGPGNRRNALSS